MFFSFHEIGVFDIPAMTDYVLKETNQENMYFLGHSLGATTFFVMASMLPEHNAKFRAMFAVAPGGFFSKNTNSIFGLSRYSGIGVSIPTQLTPSQINLTSGTLLFEVPQKKLPPMPVYLSNRVLPKCSFYFQFVNTLSS